MACVNSTCCTDKQFLESKSVDRIGFLCVDFFFFNNFKHFFQISVLIRSRRKDYRPYIHTFVLVAILFYYLKLDFGNKEIGF